jgi:signal transduction histidine kinase
LAELNKSYLDLIGFVAHELKGMLASAVINAYSLRDGLLGMLNFKQKKAIDSICRNLDYLDATVKKFLNLSRIEREKLEINKQPIFLRKDIAEVSIQTFAKLIEDKQMTVINRIDPTIRVNADPDLMQIVMNNLINNAAKYGVEGGRIELSSRLLNGKVEVEVYNDGRPIQPNEIPMLFKKFSRLDNPEKKKVKGTGLGLYITKQIIEAHGGSIRVEPRANGNAFIFQIERK